MITIIFGPPRIGKTAFMVYQLNERAFDYERNLAMQEELFFKNQNGFNLTIPEHCVSANFNITFEQDGYSPRKARLIDPKKLGFSSKKKDRHFLLPYETIGIMEAQEFFNSRKYKEFDLSQSAIFEQHGHNHIDFFLDCQRPGLIDLNIRELSNFIEIRSLDVKYDKKMWFESMTWTVRIFDNSFALDSYMRSGKKDTNFFEEVEIVSNYNVLELYNSWSLEPKFYAGHFDKDFDLKYGLSFGPTKNDYIDYLKDIGEIV